MFGKRTTEANTLTLIRKWSMDGAPGAPDGRFGSPPDVHAAVAVREEEPTSAVPPAALPPVMMKPADEDEWRPLLVGM